MSAICPNCGSSKSPELRAVWSTKDKIIAVVLFLAFFPAGIVFLLVKQSKDKRPVCPDCKAPYSGKQESPSARGVSGITSTVKAAAKNPEVRQSLRKLKKDAIALRDTFDVNG